jgi:hypothetical protein
MISQFALFAALPSSHDKRCAGCRKRFPLERFPRHGNSRDGRRRHCRACLLAGRHQPRADTPALRAAREARQARAAWISSHRRATARHVERHPEQAAAGKALRAAVKRGEVAKADRCQARGCSSSKSIEAHHHNYQRPLEILWLCAACHRRGHARGYILPAEGLPAHLGTIPEMITEPVAEAA